MGTEIREGGTRARAVSGIETLPVAEILPGRSFSRRVEDILLRAVVDTSLFIVEGLGEGMEWAARRLNGDYRRHMKELYSPQAPETFRSIAVIGAAGKVGELFTRTLSPHVPVEAVVRERRWQDEGSHPSVRFSPDIGLMLAREPDAVIVATPNPTGEVLEEIAKHAKKPLTLILPQNGVDVVPTAERILGESSCHTIVRASLFTALARDEVGNLVYNPKKKRIALAPVGHQAVDNLYRAKVLFETAGFDTEVVPDFQSMEWTKLVTNLLGSSSAVTGLSPREAFSDREIFALEHRALRDRLAILKAANIRFADIKWVRKLGWLARMPLPIASIFRKYIANMISTERNNQPAVAVRQIDEGDKRVESTNFYHRPVVKLAKAHNLQSPVDRAIIDILERHERSDFSLTSLQQAERRRLLLEVYDLESQDVFIPSSIFVTTLAEAWFNLLARKFEILGRENLEAVAESLRSGKSVLLTPNHRAHPDHVAVAKAVREILGRDYPPIFVSGMLFVREPLSRLLQRAYSRIKVWTVKKGTGEDDRWKSRIINRKTGKVVDELLSERPRIIVLYPEGTRTRTGQLQAPVPGVSSWIDSRFALIVPVAIRGTERMLPPSKNLPSRAKMTIEFGIPKQIGELRQEATELSRKERDGYVSGQVMAAIAAMLPKEERGGY